MSVLIANSLAILLSCGLNNHTLELMLRVDSGFGPLLSVCQFVFVALVGLFAQVDWRRLRWRAPTIPLWFHALIAFVFFSSQLLNNAAYIFGVGQPLTLCLRSSGLAISFLMGRFLFDQAYNTRQLLAVLAIVIGVSVTVAADSALNLCRDCSLNDTLAVIFQPHASTDGANAGPFGLSRASSWMMGVGVLLVALAISSAMGHLQDMAYKRWERKPDEIMFYAHVLSLPGFVLFGGELGRSVERWSASPPLLLWNDSVSLGPQMWIFLAANVATQWMCVRSVYELTSRQGTLTCTVVLTLRKFLSLLGSVWYFENEWTLTHWVGTFLVFAGVVLYSLAGKPAAVVAVVDSESKTKSPRSGRRTIRKKID
jgi:UDP-xylose/UDP-N-acetylglucosamine transporter B4